MRFHLDEHVVHAIADGLRRRGIDVTTTADASLVGKPDGDHFDFAKREGRVIVTQDTDFLRPTLELPFTRKGKGRSEKSFVAWH